MIYNRLTLKGEIMSKKLIEINKCRIALYLVVVNIISLATGCTKEESTPVNTPSIAVETPVTIETPFPVPTETVSPEESVLETLREKENQITEALADGTESFLDSAEEDLIFVLDFFAGKTEINGYYFSDLTDAAKEKASEVIEAIMNAYNAVKEDPAQAIEDFGYYLYEKEQAVKESMKDFYYEHQDDIDAITEFGIDTATDIKDNALGAWERIKEK